MIDLDEIDVIIITTYQVNCCEKREWKVTFRNVY